MAKHSPEPTAVNESCLDVNAVTDEELLLCFLVRHNFGAFGETFYMESKVRYLNVQEMSNNSKAPIAANSDLLSTISWWNY